MKKVFLFLTLPPFMYVMTVLTLALFAAFAMGDLTYFASGLEFWTVPYNGFVVFERILGLLMALATAEAVYESV